MCHDDDTTYVKLALGGNEHAFEQLVKRYQNMVYGIALRYVKDVQQAEDIAQEAFIEAYLHLGQLKTPEKFAPWIYGIVRNLANRWLQREKREFMSLEEANLSEMEQQMKIVSISPSTGPQNPAEVYEQKTFRASILNAISELPSKSREVLILFYIDDFSYKDISNFLNISEAAVQSRLQIARGRLQERMMKMVKDALRDNRPVPEFAPQVVKAAVQQAQDAFERRNDPRRAERVIEYCAKALKTFEPNNPDYQGLQGDIYQWQGCTWLHPLKQPQQALRAFEQSLQLAKLSSDKPREIDALMGMAEAFIQLGDTKKAEDFFQQALARAQMICDSKREGAIRYRQSRMHIGELQDTAQVHEFLYSIEAIATGISNRAHANIASPTMHLFPEEIHHASLQALLDVIELVPESLPESVNPNSPFGYGYFDLKQEESKIQLGSCPEMFYTGHAKESNPPEWSSGVFRHLFFQIPCKPPALPIQSINIGRQWEDENEGFCRQFIIESIDETVQGPVFKFKHCMKLKIIVSQKSELLGPYETGWVWFARGVGLVKIRHEYATGETTEIDLIDYRLTELSDDYFPLSLDNMWLYRWTKGAYTITEKWRVLSLVDEPDCQNGQAFRLTHARYYLYMPEIKIGDIRDVESLIKALGDEDRYVRMEAAYALGNLGDSRGIEPLRKTLGDKDKFVQLKATIALAKMNEPGAIELLIETLADKDPDIRRSAADALGEIGDARAVEPLIEALGASGVRGRAAEALGKLGDIRAIEPLIKVLSDENERVRSVAAEALGRIGDARAVEPLIGALGNKDKWVRRDVAEALGRIGDTRAVEPLIRALSDEEPVVRDSVAWALGEIGDTLAVEPLRGSLNEQDKHVQLSAKIALAKMDEPGAIELVIEALADEDSDIRWRAADALGEIGDTLAVEPLRGILNDQDKYVQLSATIALAKMDETGAIELVIEMLDDEDSRVRWRAAKTLGEIENSQAVEPLEKLLDKENDDYVRKIAEEALKKLGVDWL
ncbi:sigma-70 family RNA polymerase sigma factor [Candidatus Poribacteria bacterium]|nr:sigma-70 family RNA polymerase sigma factor [Candidatus Poribacteria bacterium]